MMDIQHLKQQGQSGMSYMSAYEYGKAKYKEIKQYLKKFLNPKHDILFQGYFRPGDNP